MTFDNRWFGKGHGVMQSRPGTPNRHPQPGNHLVVRDNFEVQGLDDLKLSNELAARTGKLWCTGCERSLDDEARLILLSVNPDRWEWHAKCRKCQVSYNCPQSVLTV